MKQSLLKMFLCVAMLLVVLVAQSQDYLFMINSDTLKTKILEVNENDVRYKDFDNLDGPIYTINKSRIDKIIYQNGKVEFFRTGESNDNNNTNTNVNLPKILTFDELMALKDDEKETYLSTINVYSIYEKFMRGNEMTKKGKKLQSSGFFFTVGGAVFVAVSGFAFSNGNTFLLSIGAAALTAGQIFFIVSIPVGASGGFLKKSAEFQYREFSLGKSYTTIQPTLNFGLTQNGVGLSLKF